MRTLYYGIWTVIYRGRKTFSEVQKKIAERYPGVTVEPLRSGEIGIKGPLSALDALSEVSLPVFSLPNGNRVYSGQDILALLHTQLHAQAEKTPSSWPPTDEDREDWYSPEGDEEEECC